MRTKLSAEASRLYRILMSRLGPDDQVDLSGAPPPAELGLGAREALRALRELVRAGLIEVRLEPGAHHRHRGGS